MNTDKLRESLFLKVLNIVAICIEVAAIAYVLMLDIKVFASHIILIHFVSLMWSLMYHLLPNVRSNSVYRFFAHTASTCIIMLAIVNVYFMLIAKEWGPLIYLAILVFFTGPAALVAITLLLLLNLDSNNTQKVFRDHQIVYIPISAMNWDVNDIGKKE